MQKMCTIKYTKVNILLQKMKQSVLQIAEFMDDLRVNDTILGDAKRESHALDIANQPLLASKNSVFLLACMLWCLLFELN